ncbi:olfactory receptor 52K2-like [Microcaecilia unicolor]|uniref:Olfactory receptor n=1 Tax=Microcaecilia unicolor TaxID=1415580 RepID=A0A6P7XXX4_9AMPH|nr:olfactory receptor 52K2-like [Microcaecilia unicolor]
MSVLNHSHYQPSFFILKGIPGLEDGHIWISIPCCAFYVCTIVANSLILFIIKTEAGLHQPMYILLSMLSGSDIALPTCVIPKMLAAFWFNSREIYFEACLIQMYFTHSFVVVESGVLTVMAFDRYVAICNPLRYTCILTSQLLAKIGLVVLLRSALLFAPLPFLLKRLTFCPNNVIAHTYCEHMSIAKLACADIRINSVYGMTAALTIIALDFPCIVLSYALILKAVIGLSTKEARVKAFNTCTAHVCVIVMFYAPIVSTVLLQRIAHKTSPTVHIIVANLYIIVPPAINPVLYSVNTKEIRQRVLKIFYHRRAI